VEASCRAQGVPVKVTDVAVVKRVGALLGTGRAALGRADAERAHAATAASTHHTARPAHRSVSLQPPDGLHPVRVETARSQHTGSDDCMVEDRSDDRGLPVEVERVPRSA